jgi:hypothetical protein
MGATNVGRSNQYQIVADERERSAPTGHKNPGLPHHFFDKPLTSISDILIRFIPR